ncbi:hypothetical protein [Micavibrio aeruginosavorus]|uniref:hypothetical protein n=1 Tax=Micavibrio aeruginosavorus TaxID=349221 RepID=UPI003F4AADD1
MKVKDLHILDRHYCIHADGYLVVGTAKHRRGLSGFVTGWCHRNSDTLHHAQNFLDIDSAHISFNAEMVELESFLGGVFDRDHQEQTVYRWEDQCIVPLGRKITKDEAKALIEKISDDHDIPVPKLLWMPDTNSSSYEEETNKIRFGHREIISLLHEMAHVLYHHRRDGERYADHAPAFVFTAIELYHQYAGIDLDTLISTARQANILGDMKSIKYIGDVSIPIVEYAIANDNAPKPAHHNVRKTGPQP